MGIRREKLDLRGRLDRKEKLGREEKLAPEVMPVHADRGVRKGPRGPGESRDHRGYLVARVANSRGSSRRSETPLSPYLSQTQL